jgi:hypothetical protein
MANAEKTKRETPLRSNKTRSDRSNRVKKREFRTANGVLGDNSLTSVTNDISRNHKRHYRGHSGFAFGYSAFIWKWYRSFAYSQHHNDILSDAG